MLEKLCAWASSGPSGHFVCQKLEDIAWSVVCVLGCAKGSI
jgi:hypothetical protein